MNEENSKHHWLRIGAIALMTFIIAFLAFYVVMQIMINRITSPAYQVRQMERMLTQQERDFERFMQKGMENPFEPKMRPRIVNLVKESGEYKVIVDLNPLDGNENAINIKIDDNELTVSGELDKKIRGSEKMISFDQTYLLDEELLPDKITKEKKGNKYIVTIPYKEMNQ